MHIAVMGAGAVGCYYGGLLARAGHTVTLIARPSHVQAIAAHGLRLQTATSDEHITLNANSDVAALKDAELVLFCVKSSDTESAGAQMKAYLRKDATVLSLQNGVDNAQRLQAVLGQDVIATVVYVATAMAGPGHVQHFGRGDLVLGQHARSEQLAELLSQAAIPSTVSNNVQGALWTKLIINCTYNAASAITQRPYGELVQQPGMWQLMRSAHDECIAVAHAAGVRLDAPLWPMIENIARTMQGQYSSTAQDLQKNKATEIDHLNGFIVRQGQQLGVSTPVNAALQTLVKALQP
ncbi:2-dehydropantoate 2-reductase [Limnohabitans sp.]|uniref:ketopantoate reductase family protein n=1 Tax=Limnohabitans sp. TaxID=1907725 RepID=UPI00311E4776